MGQAVSWVRAEQTGYWQRGDTTQADPHFDQDQIDRLVRTIEAHNASWRDWFTEQGVQPHSMTYEDLIEDPHRAVLGLLEQLGVEAPSGWTPRSSHVRQADEVNREWIRHHPRSRDRR